jgi:hypothetical protein
LSIGNERARDRAIRTPAQKRHDKSRTQAAALRRAISLVKDQAYDKRIKSASTITELDYQNGVLGIGQPSQSIAGVNEASTEVKSPPDATTLRGLIGDDDVYKELTSLVAGNGMDTKKILPILEEKLAANIAARDIDRGPVPAGLEFGGGRSGAHALPTSARNLLAPEFEAAAAYIANQTGARLRFQMPTSEPRGTGIARGASSRGGTDHFTSPILSEVIPPELAAGEGEGKSALEQMALRRSKLPTGKSLLEGPAFEALPAAVQDELRAMIEHKDRDTGKTTYRSITDILQPIKKKQREISTGDEVADAARAALEGDYISPDNRKIGRSLMTPARLARGAAATTASLTERLGRYATGAEMPAESPETGERTAESVLRSAAIGSGGGGGIGGAVNVNVLNWPESLASGGAGGGGGGGRRGGGGGTTPPGEPEESGETPSGGKRPKRVSHRYPMQIIGEPRAAANTLTPIEPTGISRQRSSALLSQRREQEQMYAGLFRQIEVGERAQSRNAVIAGRNRSQAINKLFSVRPESREQKAGMYQGLFDQADARDDYVSYTEATGRSYYGPRAQSPRAQRARLREARRTARLGESALLLGREQDVSQDEIAPIRAQLRRATRSVPKRGFGASLTDVITSAASSMFNVAGPNGTQTNPLEHQLEYLGRAEEEGNELHSLVGRRDVLRTSRRSALQQARKLPLGSQERADLLESSKETGKQIRDLAPAIDLSKRRLKEFTGEVNKGSTVMKSFAAAAVGGTVAAAVGSVTTGLGFAVTGPLISAVGEGLTAALGPEIERLLGRPGATAQILGVAEPAVTAGRGNALVTQAGVGQALGLSSDQTGIIGGLITDQASIEQGNKNLATIGGALFADQRLLNTGVQGVGSGTSGALGTSVGQVPSTAEIIAGLFDKTIANPATSVAPPKTIRIGALQPPTGTKIVGSTDIGPTPSGIIGSPNGTSNGATPTPSPQAGADIGPGTNVQNPDFAQFQAAKKLTSDTIGVLNTGLERGSDFAHKFTADVKQLSQTDISNQIYALRNGIGGEGANKLADVIASGKVAITNKSGAVTTDVNELRTALSAEALGTLKPDYQQLLDLNSQQIKNQFWQENQQTQMALGTGQYQGQGILQSQFGIEYAQNRLGSATSSIAKQDQGKVKGLSDTVALYKQIDSEGEQAVTTAKNFVSTWATSPQVAGQFNAALDGTVKLGTQISNIQVGQEMAHAEYAAQQYNVQIYQTNRSLSDAVNLQKTLNGERASGLGQIQAEQFLLQRESQALSLGLSQKQINLQMAMASFTAPGDTPEERAARIEQAKIEADYAQKQLNIQKQLYGLEGKSFRIQADRSVYDLTKQLTLLTQGRAITINDALAQKKIAALNLQMGREMKIVNAVFNDAQTRANDMLGLTSKFANELVQDAATVFNKIMAYYKSYYEMLPVGGGYSPVGGTGGGGGKRNASGFLGTVSGETKMIMGEAGNETLAILRNPRFFGGQLGQGGGAANVYITITGNSFKGEEDLQAMAYKIERILNQKGALMGLRRPI